MLGGIWTIAIMLGSLKSDQKNCQLDIKDLQVHQREHDQWHLERLVTGVDERRASTRLDRRKSSGYRENPPGGSRPGESP